MGGRIPKGHEDQVRRPQGHADNDGRKLARTAKVRPISVLLPAIGLREADHSRGFIPGNLLAFGFPTREYADHCIVSRPSVPFLSVRDRSQLWALSALALLISVLVELVLAVSLMVLPWGFSAFLEALLHFFTLAAETSAGQDLVVLLWAAISGVLFVVRVGRHASMKRARIVALIAGAISPWAMRGLGRIEGHLWPALRETRGPLDRPLMTLLLLVCALVTPWLASRAARVDAQANTAPQ
jgi:hypothetical protein